MLEAQSPPHHSQEPTPERAHDCADFLEQSSVARVHQDGEVSRTSSGAAGQEDGEPAGPVPEDALALDNLLQSPGHEIAFVTLICFAQLFAQACLGQVVPILSYIGPTYGHLNEGELSWIVAAFSLTVGTFILISGRIGDILGHKHVFIAGWLWLSLWSVLAGLSALTRAQIFLDVCRAMQGIGVAAMLPCALALLGRAYPNGARKAMVFAIFGATAPNGFLLGALFAGVCARFAWWPWSFWLMAICSALVASLSIPIIPSSIDENGTIGAQRFDYAGSVTAVIGLVLFNVAWNQGPVAGWGAPSTIVLLVLGIFFALGFFIVERHVAQPLIPGSALSSTVGFVLGCIALGWSSFGIWMYYLWQYLEVLRDEPALLGVAHISPVGVAGIVAALLTGKLIRTIRPELILLGALVAFCAGNLLVATMSINQIYWAETFLTTIITSFGMDMSFPAATLILSNSMPRQHQGIAASLVLTVVNYSISIGLGIGGTVESQLREQQGELLAYRGAVFAGAALSGAGIVLALVFLIYSSVHRRSAATQKKRLEDS